MAMGVAVVQMAAIVEAGRQAAARALKVKLAVMMVVNDMMG